MMGSLKIFYECVLKTIANAVDVFLNLWWLITAFIALLMAVNAVISLRKRANTCTKKLLDTFKQESKYIPHVFIELNNVKETIRFFIFGDKKKWKRRIINDFNQLYDNAYGELLRDGIRIDEDSNIKFHIKFSEKMCRISQTVSANLELHEAFRHRKFKNYTEDFEESSYVFEIAGRTYTEKLTDLKNYSMASSMRYLILTGNAGTGKTNFLCNVSELLLAYKLPCLFINARDMGENPENYIFDCLHINGWFRGHPEAYFWLADKLLLFRRKWFYIIIDAVNENEFENFGHQLAVAINQLFLYKRFKIIVSCRDEYFNNKFEGTIKNEVVVPAFVLDAKEERYNGYALERLFRAYGEYFRFSGFISDYVKDRLAKQLLLLRIFFEVYHDSGESIVNLNRHELFARYIKEVQKKVSVDLEMMLRKLAQTMMSRNEYSALALKNVPFTEEELCAIPVIADRSVLISKKINVHENTILSNSEEYIYFVFDEIRDFVLAKYILESCMIDKETGLDEVEKQLDRLSLGKRVCLEGILVHTYSFCKVDNSICRKDKDRICHKILYEYIKTAAEIETEKSHGRYGKDFEDPGIGLIVGTGLPIEDFEIIYLKEQFQKDDFRNQSAKFFYLLVQSALNGGQYSIYDYLRILYKSEDEENISALIENIFGKGYMDDQRIRPEDAIPIYERLIIVNEGEARAFRQMIMIFFACYTFREKKKNEAGEYFRAFSDCGEVWNEVLQHLKFVKE